MQNKTWLRFRVPLGFLFAGWYLIVARPSSRAFLTGCIVLVTVGCALRSWAAGYLLKGKRVAVGGPYAFIRHPLYVGSFLIGFGFCLVLWRRPLPIHSLILWSAFLLGFGVLYRGKSLAEEQELSTHLGEPYQRYAKKVPAFLPWRGRIADLGLERFSGELYRRNREYQCILGSAALIAILTLKYFHAL